MSGTSGGGGWPGGGGGGGGGSRQQQQAYFNRGRQGYPTAASGSGNNGGRAQSYPGPDDAGLLQKLLKRRQSNAAMQAPQPQLTSAQLRRNRDKLVALLEEGQLSLLEAAGSGPSPLTSPILPGGGEGLAGVDELLPAAVEEVPASYYTGPISIHATAASYDLKGLREHLEARGYRCTEFPGVLYSRCECG